MIANDYFNKIKQIAMSDGMPVRLSELIAAQAAHETANFTSKVFVQNNNAFGYKYVKGAIWQDGAGRTSTEGDPYAKYSTLANSVHELTAWINRREREGRFPPLGTIDNPDQYAIALKNCRYYGDTITNYATGLASALNRYSVSNLA